MTVVDASVAVKWFLPEDRSPDARRLLEDDADLIAPRIILIEVAHVLWKAHKRGRLPGDGLQPAEAVMSSQFGNGADTDKLAIAAIGVMRALDLAVFDCLYLALAQREGVPLVTAEASQFAAARKAGIKARLL